jgi:hypothetical protein
VLAGYTSSAAGVQISVERRIGGAWHDQDALCGGVSSVTSSSRLFSSFIPCFSLMVYQFVALCFLNKIFFFWWKSLVRLGVHPVRRPSIVSPASLRSTITPGIRSSRKCPAIAPFIAAQSCAPVVHVLQGGPLQLMCCRRRRAHPLLIDLVMYLMFSFLF